MGRQRRLVQCPPHELQPTVTSGGGHGKGHVPHPQTWVAPLFDITRRAAKATDQKITQSHLRPWQVVWRIHGAEKRVVWDLPIERRNDPFESLFPDGGVQLMVFHGRAILLPWAEPLRRV